MAICISSFDKDKFVSTLSEELRNDIMIAVEGALNESGLRGDEYQQAWDNAFNSRVSALEDTIEIEYFDNKLSYLIFNNLRAEQDNMEPALQRFDRLVDAIKAFNELPESYTTALGGCYDGSELDFIHRVNGEAVKVNDYKRIDRWDNPLVDRAIGFLCSRLGVQYELDSQIFSNARASVLIPLAESEVESKELNSYFMDKYLRPEQGTEDLCSAVDEVLVVGKGWMKADKFFKELNAIDPYESSKKLKVMSMNINYVDLNGRVGQADIKPQQFVLLKKQTIERTAQHPAIDAQIDYANKVRAEQMQGKGKDKSKTKGRSDDYEK